MSLEKLKTTVQEFHKAATNAEPSSALEMAQETEAGKMLNQALHAPIADHVGQAGDYLALMASGQMMGTKLQTLFVVPEGIAEYIALPDVSMQAGLKLLYMRSFDWLKVKALAATRKFVDNNFYEFTDEDQTYIKALIIKMWEDECKAAAAKLGDNLVEVDLSAQGLFLGPIKMSKPIPFRIVSGNEPSGQPS